MMRPLVVQFLCTAAAFFLVVNAAVAAPIVIAHRGASGYLPEHTLPAYALAYGMGADYIEQDVVLTRDSHFIALHDLHLEATTDVEERFPGRHREDGKWYAADFTLAEIKTLSVHERTSNRFPMGKSRFEVPTLAEAIELIQGLNKTTGRDVGIYPELKGAAFHREAGFDAEAQLLELLGRYGYTGPDAKVFVQCFEEESLKKMRFELKTELPLVQLISGRASQAGLRTEAGLRAVAAYANGVGPSKNIIENNPAVVAWARAARLVVHPYTLRDDDRPVKYATAQEELRQFFGVYGVAGVFTDFPDTARAVVDALAAE